MLNSIRKNLGLSHEVDNRHYRREIYCHYRDHQYGIRMRECITDIKVIKKGDSTNVVITTHRPGILIGKGGRDIDDLKLCLQEEFGQNLEIRIVENKMWYNLY